MHQFLIWFFRLFVVAYVVALAIFLIGTFQLFGHKEEPMAGIFLIPLGLPWFRVADLFGEALTPWFATITPLINATILWALARRTRPGKA